MDGNVICHPFIIGELACGQLTNRREILDLLDTLPKTAVAEQNEILEFIESKKLFGIGIGFIDTHLLASALLSRAKLWTEDKNLKKAANRIHLAYQG